MQITNIIWSIIGLAAGVAIGYGFGLIQEAAHRRNQRRENDGRLKSGWVLMPGSMGRVVFLLLALVLVQIICPLLFAGGVQWLVSAGVAVGYGGALYLQLRQKLAASKVAVSKL